MADVLPFVQWCPACGGSGEANVHLKDCAAHELGACLCLPSGLPCELCLGTGRVEPRLVTVWVHDMRRGLLDGWAGGMRP